MKNITVSAEDGLLMQARKRARNENRTLNELFREWLAQYVTQSGAETRYDEMMQRMEHVTAGRRFSREEMHARR
jgi:hypothetical protein